MATASIIENGLPGLQVIRPIIKFVPYYKIVITVVALYSGIHRCLQTSTNVYRLIGINTNE